jgi:hypothetical protein
MYIMKFNDYNFYLKYLVTSKARITAFVISVQGFVSSSPTIAYIFAWLLIKLCQLTFA